LTQVLDVESFKQTFDLLLNTPLGVYD